MLPKLLSILCLLATMFATHAAERPNVIFLFIDDMGYADPSCFGNPLVKTPHIDSLAAGGLKLGNFYVNSPICSASRTALATGQYQQRWRIHSYLSSRNDQKRRKMADWLEPKAVHTAQVFKNAGYATAHFGKWHLGGGRDVGDAPLPTEYGFDETYVSFEGLGDRVLPNGNLADESAKLGRGKIDRAPKHEMTRIYTDKSIDFITRNKNKPFYLELFPNDVHDPFEPAEGEAEKFAKLTDNPEEQKFLAVLVEMDRQIGRLLAHLDKTGLTKRTLVIFTSDNGPTDWEHYYKRGIQPPGFTGPFYGRKWSLYEGGIRMPFIARWPGHVPAGKTDQTSVVAAIDLQPTLAAIAGISLPNSFSLSSRAKRGGEGRGEQAPLPSSSAPEKKIYDGLDRSAVLLGNPSARSQPLFWEYGVLGSIQPGKKEHRSPGLAMRDGNWKLLCQPDGSGAQLFNLADDPGEKNNLADRVPDRVATMKPALLKWWDEMRACYP